MTDKRRYTLTAISLTIGLAMSVLIFYIKRGTFDNQTWLFFGTVMGYSILIVFGIGWFLQRRSKKKNQ
ncbi:MAG: hypothetical protein ACHQNT_00660 [Bacteroidia bacterium]